MARSRRKVAVIAEVCLALILLAIVLVLHQSSDSPTPTLVSGKATSSVSPQVLGTVFTVPSVAPDPADSVLFGPVPVQTTLFISTITALSTVIVSGQPVVHTEFSTATATARVTLKPKDGPTVLSTRTFLATITQSGKELVTTQTATAIQVQTQTQTNTETQTETATVTHTSIAPGPTTTIILPGPTQTVTAPGPTVTETATVTQTPPPLLVFCPGDPLCPGP